jgi:hypothetical protein
MAQILLHGNLHVTIFEASALTNPGRASGNAPKFIRKVRSMLFFFIFFHFQSRPDRSTDLILSTPNPGVLVYIRSNGTNGTSVISIITVK